MNKTKIMLITIITILMLGVILYSGWDALKKLPQEEGEGITESLEDDNFFVNENGNFNDVSGDDIITVPSGYAVVEDGHIVDFVYE